MMVWGSVPNAHRVLLAPHQRAQAHTHSTPGAWQGRQHTTSQPRGTHTTQGGRDALLQTACRRWKSGKRTQIPVPAAPQQSQTRACLGTPHTHHCGRTPEAAVHDGVTRAQHRRARAWVASRERGAHLDASSGTLNWAKLHSELKYLGNSPRMKAKLLHSPPPKQHRRWGDTPHTNGSAREPKRTTKQAAARTQERQRETPKRVPVPAPALVGALLPLGAGGDATP
jgi:hypothetical protein